MKTVRLCFFSPKRLDKAYLLQKSNKLPCDSWRLCENSKVRLRLEYARGEIVILSQRDLKGLLSMKEVLSAVEDAFKLHALDKTFQPLKTVINYGEGGKYRLTSLPCYVRDKGAGIKWVSNNRDNRDKGLPTVSGILILNDETTSLPIAVMDATWMTTMRTAGHAAVAAKYLAKKNASSVAIIGCGAEGRTHLEAINQFFEPKEIRIYDVMKDYAKRYADQMSNNLDLEIEIAENPRSAVKDVDIICMTTTATEPVVMSSDVAIGCFVAGTAQFRDLDPNLSREADKWVVGELESDFINVSHSQNIMKLSKENIYAEIGEIIVGKKPGRETEEERIVFTHAGMGALDVLTGLLAYKKAKEKNIGLLKNLLE